MCVGRYGIPSVEIIDRIVDSYRYAGIPLETFVSDSQYMDGDQDFTLSASYPLPAMKVSPLPQPPAPSDPCLDCHRPWSLPYGDIGFLDCLAPGFSCVPQ